MEGRRPSSSPEERAGSEPALGRRPSDAAYHPPAKRQRSAPPQPAAGPAAPEPSFEALAGLVVGMGLDTSHLQSLGLDPASLGQYLQSQQALLGGMGPPTAGGAEARATPSCQPQPRPLNPQPPQQQGALGYGADAGGPAALLSVGQRVCPPAGRGHCACRS